MKLAPVSNVTQIADASVSRATTQASQLAEMPQEDQPAQNEEYREAFQQFVGETFFGILMKSMRSTLDKPAYFHGGRAEEVFTAQLDQQLSQELAKESASQFSDPMFELMNLPRH